jgi:hypothetical protein
VIKPLDKKKSANPVAVDIGTKKCYHLIMVEYYTLDDIYFGNEFLIPKGSIVVNSKNSEIDDYIIVEYHGSSWYVLKRGLELKSTRDLKNDINNLIEGHNE